MNRSPSSRLSLDFFQLREQPFGVSPDPRFLYFGAAHREAMASALYGVSTGRGFTAIVAYPGMGKTTLLFDFLSKIKNHARTVFLFQPQSDARDLIRCILADIEIEDDGTDLVRMHRKLNEFLLAEARRGRKLVVVLDEAQTLDNEVLEAVRMLSNFETPREKLIHLVLAGQPQLADKLACRDLLQLRQRISMISHLFPFNVDETQKYIEHRLRVAGNSSNAPMFSSAAIRIITKYTQGIPRNINNVCFNAMSIACVGKQKTIDERIILEVIDDLDLKIRTNARAAVSSETKFKAVHDNSNFEETLQPSLKVQPSIPSTPSPGFEERTVPAAATGRVEWIVEFSGSDLDSLHRSKQQGSEKLTGSYLPPAPKVDTPVPSAPPSLNAAPVPPPRVAAAFPGTMDYAPAFEAGNHRSVDVNSSVSDAGRWNPAPPPRVVGGRVSFPLARFRTGARWDLKWFWSSCGASLSVGSSLRHGTGRKVISRPRHRSMFLPFRPTPQILRFCTSLKERWISLLWSFWRYALTLSDRERYRE